MTGSNVDRERGLQQLRETALHGRYREPFAKLLPAVAARPRARAASGIAQALSGQRTAVLWISLGLTALFVLITSEVLLVADYPMYHAYRLQVIADRGLLIPHSLCGTIALLAGPVQFSSRLRQRRLKFHRVLGRVYAICVFIGAPTGIALAAGRPGMPGTCMQAAAWTVCTTAALITARNRQIARHRQWMARSYAVTFTFVSSRVLNLWPRYWSHLGDSLSAVGVIAFTLASLLVVDLAFNWRELTTRRA